MKKLTFVISQIAAGGAERVLVSLANELVKNGYQISLIVLSNASTIYNIDENIKIITLKHQLRKTILCKLFFNLILLIKLYKAIRKIRSKVVISFIRETNIRILLLKPFLESNKIIVSEHNNYNQGKPGIRLLRRYLYRYAHVVTVLTNYDLSYYKDFCNAKVIKNPAPFNIVNSIESNSSNTIIAIGSMHNKQKGFDLLLKAFSLICYEASNWNLFIIGDGYLKEELIELSKTLNITKQVNFIGIKENILNIYKNASLFVLSSRWEGLPVVLLEAMSQGIPVIAFDCISGPGEIITDNYDGILIEPYNVRKLANGILHLIQNENKRNLLAKNALRTVEKYSINKIVCMWTSIIENDSK